MSLADSSAFKNLMKLFHEEVDKLCFVFSKDGVLLSVPNRINSMLYRIWWDRRDLLYYKYNNAAEKVMLNFEVKNLYESSKSIDKKIHNLVYPHESNCLYLVLVFGRREDGQDHTNRQHIPLYHNSVKIGKYEDSVYPEEPQIKLTSEEFRDIFSKLGTTEFLEITGSQNALNFVAKNDVSAIVYQRQIPSYVKPEPIPLICHEASKPDSQERLYDVSMYPWDDNTTSSSCVVKLLPLEELTTCYLKKSSIKALKNLSSITPNNSLIRFYTTCRQNIKLSTKMGKFRRVHHNNR